MTTYFQDCGLVIGFISYPFEIDGHKLYKEVFKEQFFKKYKHGINKYSYDPLPDHLYIPNGYRLFGNYGLAVISLIDDFAFCDRIFHANHGYNSDTVSGNFPNPDYRYNCKVITGVADSEDKNYLKNKAENTFLRKKDKFPFIGIAKLKINYKILFGKGVVLTDLIKNYINEQSDEIKEREQGKFDSIIIDCFDNDELTVISFSNNISTINNFFSLLRNLTCNTLKIQPENDRYHKHIFLSNYTNIGYDTDYDFKKESSPDSAFIDPEGIKDINIKLTWETKIGHINLFWKYIKKQLTIIGKPKSILTGGNTLSYHIPLTQINELEKLCTQEEVKANVQRIKIALCWEYEDHPTSGGTDLELRQHTDDLSHIIFNPTYLGNIRKLLNECRVAKIVRERMLKIYGLFNDSIKDILHAGYFFELRGALNNVESLLVGFMNDSQTKIGDIDSCLSESITSFEEAYYNRFHQKDTRDTNLEYNGGIQQHLTSFDFTYKEILKILHPQNTKEKSQESFISISGYEKVASTRLNLRLNINQISYPELFATIVWKEAANFSYSFLRDKVKLDSNLDKENKLAYKYQEKFDIWSKFISQKNTFINIQSILKHEKYYVENDEIYHIVSDLLSKETIEYLFIDSQSYHFGFHRNYELFYHFYWKYFLQISQHYDRNGKIEKEYFIPYLLRLFMVGFHNNIIDVETTLEKENRDKFIREHRFISFDPVLSELWFLCYEKVYKCACTIWNELNKFHFEEISDREINAIESLIVKDNPKLNVINEEVKKGNLNPSIANSIIIRERKYGIDNMRNDIKQHKLITDEDEVNDDGNHSKSKDYLICLLNAYLLAIKDLDESNGTKVMKCVPRNAHGQILLEENNDLDPLKQNISNLPVDPLGGIFISNYMTRGEYFAYRTSFYRSLWNYAMENREIPIKI
jgi:hypothetical protein